MDWSRWLRDFAIFGAVAAALLAVLRSRAGCAALRRLAGAVSTWSSAKALAIVLVLTIGARVGAMATFEPPYESDVREYVEKAEQIADHGTPRAQETRADGSHFFRPLGSSLALAGWYKATGTRGLASARWHGIALAAAAAWLILALGRVAERETEGRLAALAYAVFLPHVVFASIPYTETFVTALTLAASVLFERLRRGRGGFADAAGLGLTCGWIGITRTEMSFLLPLAAVLLLLARRHEIARTAGLASVAAALFCVPFAINHEMRSGYPGHLRTSAQGGLILYFGNNPIEVNGYGNATPEVVASAREMYAKDPTGGLARDAAVEWIAAHPLQVVVNAPKKLFHLWLAEPQGFRWHAGAGQPPAGMSTTLAKTLRCVAYVQSLMLLFAGVAGLRHLGAERRFWVVSLALHAAVWCLLASSTRNRYPLEPWLMFAAAAAVVATGIAAPRAEMPRPPTTA